MSVLKNDNNTIEKNINSKSVYELPAVVRREKDEISFEKALIVSILLHPAVIIILLLASIVLRLLGIDFDMLKKPNLKPKDIEFVLVEKEAPPIDKRPVSLPQASAPKSPDKKPAAPKQPTQKPVVKQQTKPSKPAVTKPAAKPEVKQPVKQSQVQQQQTPAPKAPAPKPAPAPVVPKATPKPLSNFNIPIPKSAIPQVAQPTTTPVTAAPK